MSRQVFVLLDFIQLVIFSIVYTYLFEKYFLWILISRVILWPTILLWPSKKKGKEESS